MTDPHCTLLPWDSDFFGLRIGRLTEDYLTPEKVDAALAWCRANEVDCLYFLAAPEQPDTIRLAEGAGFHLVDIRVTLASSSEGATVQQGVRPFQASDIDLLEEIAANSHQDSRFFADGNFPEERCRALYQTWIRRSCQGWAQAVFVAEVDGLASGYCTCHIEDGAGSIGLVALAPRAQGQGAGKRLVLSALSYFRCQSVPVVTVVTQGRNIHAQRLYQRCGFVTRSLMLWYHKWPRQDTKGAAGS